MAGQILVPLKRHDRIGEIISCLEKIAEPGMTSFLKHFYPCSEREVNSKLQSQEERP